MVYWPSEELQVINLAIYSIMLVLVLIGLIRCVRRKDAKYLLCHRKANAKILDIDEVKVGKLMLFNSLYYFYPRVRVVYEVSGKEYDVAIDAKNLQMSELDQFGSARDDSRFPWRTVKVGDTVVIFYSRMFPEISCIKRFYSSER